MQMTDQTMMMRRREHSSLHLNGSQTEMKRSDVSKISVHDDTCMQQFQCVHAAWALSGNNLA